MHSHLTNLSRTISLALRHCPEKFQLTLDEFGWVLVVDLVKGIKKYNKQWNFLDVADVYAAAHATDKRRFEFEGDKIRALYGHSVPTKIKMSATIPPKLLYHGTELSAILDIQSVGLLPMKRQYVHLSTNIATAKAVASRHTCKPVIVLIHTNAALSGGCEFYHPNKQIWLSNRIPALYLEVVKS